MKSKNSLIELWLAMGLAVGLVSCAGGGGGKSMQNIIPENDADTCPRPTSEECKKTGGCFRVLPASCCDGEGNLKKTQGPECLDSSQASTAHVNNSLAQLARTAEAGQTSAAHAAGLEGESQQVQAGSNGSAATASDRLSQQEDPRSAALGNPSEQGSGAPTSLLPLAPSEAGRLSGGRGSSSGLGGGGTGLGSFGSGIKTDPAMKPLGSLTPAADTVPAYAGGGGSRGGGGRFDSGSLFGSGSGSDGMGGKAQDSLHLGRNPAGGDSVMGSLDPENYFSMLKPSDNLFKIVERRYTSKAKTWALSQAEDTQAAVKKLVK